MRVPGRYEVGNDGHYIKINFLTCTCHAVVSSGCEGILKCSSDWGDKENMQSSDGQLLEKGHMEDGRDGRIA
jgi:hypothetical protein